MTHLNMSLFIRFNDDDSVPESKNQQWDSTLSLTNVPLSANCKAIASGRYLARILHMCLGSVILQVETRFLPVSYAVYPCVCHHYWGSRI